MNYELFTLRAGQSSPFESQPGIRHFYSDLGIARRYAQLYSRADAS
jgi:hypothetical protein